MLFVLHHWKGDYYTWAFYNLWTKRSCQARRRNGKDKIWSWDCWTMPIHSKGCNRKGCNIHCCHLTSLKQKRNLIITHYRHHRRYQICMWCHQTGMITLSTSSYSSTTHMDNTEVCQHWGLMWLTICVNTEVWCGLPYFRTVAVHDKTDRESCQIGIQSYGLPSGYTPLQQLLQNTGIPWITIQDLCCV